MPAAVHGLFPAVQMQQVKLSGSSVLAALARKAAGTLAAGGDWGGSKTIDSICRWALLGAVAKFGNSVAVFGARAQWLWLGAREGEEWRHNNVGLLML